MQLCNNCIHQKVCGHRKKIEDWLDSREDLFFNKLDTDQLLADIIFQITKHYQNACKFYGAIE